MYQASTLLNEHVVSVPNSWVWISIGGAQKANSQCTHLALCRVVTQLSSTKVDHYLIYIIEVDKHVPVPSFRDEVPVSF